MGYHYQILTRVKSKEPLKVLNSKQQKLADYLVPNQKITIQQELKEEVQKKIDAMIEDIKLVQKRWEPHEKAVIWEMSQDLIRQEIQLDPLKVNEEYRKLSNFDTLGQLKHGLPVALLTKSEQDKLREYDTGIIGKNGRPVLEQIEDDEIDPIINAWKHPTPLTKQSRVIQLFIDKKGPNGNYETITKVLIPYVRMWMIAPQPTIGKRGQALILTFKFENPEYANLMESRFEVYKNRGDNMLRGVSRRFETRKEHVLPKHFQIKRRVGRPIGRKPNQAEQKIEKLLGKVTYEEWAKARMPPSSKPQQDAQEWRRGDHRPKVHDQGDLEMILT